MSKNFNVAWLVKIITLVPNKQEQKFSKANCIFTHLLVDEDHRRKGYGTKALEQAEIIAKDLGCDTIHLKVETHSWMHEWYLRLGYKFLTNAENNYTWLTKSI